MQILLTPIKDKQTTRLFYGKWLYKVSIRLTGAGVLRNMYFMKDPVGWLADNSCSMLRREAQFNKDNIIKIVTFLNQNEKEKYAVRIESNILDFYTNDKLTYDVFKQKFYYLIRNSFSPKENDVARLLENEKIILTKKYPHNKYQYRVYLQPHKIQYDRKINFIEWLKLQEDKVTFSESLEDWFLRTTYNWERRYFLVDDSKTLLMLKMHSPEAVGTVYKYVISDK